MGHFSSSKPPLQGFSDRDYVLELRTKLCQNERISLDNVFFLREKNLSSFLLDVDGFSRLFLLKTFDFHSEPGEFLVFVLSTVSLSHRGRKTKFFSRDVPN